MGEKITWQFQHCHRKRHNLDAVLNCYKENFPHILNANRTDFWVHEIISKCVIHKAWRLPLLCRRRRCVSAPRIGLVYPVPHCAVACAAFPAYLLSINMLHQSYIKWICRGGARPLRRSYLDHQWRMQYVNRERIQYIRVKTLPIPVRKVPFRVLFYSDSESPPWKINNQNPECLPLYSLDSGKWISGISIPLSSDVVSLQQPIIISRQANKELL
jgi:hypothetical protein